LITCLLLNKKIKSTNMLGYSKKTNWYNIIIVMSWIIQHANKQIGIIPWWSLFFMFASGWLVTYYMITSIFGDFTEIHVFELWCCECFLICGSDFHCFIDNMALYCNFIELPKEQYWLIYVFAVWTFKK